MSTLVDLVVEDPGWDEALPDLGEVAETGARLALSVTGHPTDGYEIAVLACDDDRIATLNAAHRDKPGPTNVLSWPALDLAPEVPGGSPLAPPLPQRNGPALMLGDVAIARQTCVREAKDADLPLKTHATHLILHSVLHLLGYDHLTDADAAVMEGLESRALTGAGLPDPYAENAGWTRVKQEDGPGAE